MASDKQDSIRFTLQTLIRLIIFALLLYFVISYISSQNRPLNDPTVLGEEFSQPTFLKDQTDRLYQSLPPESRQKLDNLPNLPAIIYIQNQINYLKDQTADFPQKQINQLKKQIIQSIYQDLMNDLDQND